MRAIFRADPAVVLWWSTRVECRSAFERRRREGSLTPSNAARIRRRFEELVDRAAEIGPDAAIRREAERLLGVHPLRATDSLNLAAASAWAGQAPSGHEFVCLDARLRAAAQTEGFALLPPTL
jgi:hypothetical protein